MDIGQAQKLTQKYIDGNCSLEERAIFESWYNQKTHNTPDPMGKLDYDALHKRLAKALPAGGVNSPILWPRVIVVAASISMILFGLYFFNTIRYFDRDKDLGLRNFANDIKPGRNTATLTLANGETINLNDTKRGVVIGNDLRYNDNTFVIQSNSEGSGSLETRDVKRTWNDGKLQRLTATTPRGGQYQITLSDGTQVWLNAGSRISFPSKFFGKERRVVLSGEAYFEVNKNKSMPFIVVSKEQEVEVLGTHFNVNAYSDELSVKTTLLEGSVRVAFLSPSGRDDAAKEGNRNSGNHLSSQGASLSVERSIVLKPNQQSVITENSIKVQQVESEGAIAWKNGLFMFEKETLGSIMRKVSRWYNVDVEYQDESLKEKTFGGTVSRFDKVSKVLRMLELTGEIRFKIENQKIIVLK